MSVVSCAWAEYYCKRDVLVLKQGFTAFRKLVKEICKMDPINSATLASLADQHMTNEGCYEGVCEVSSNVQMFIAKANTGGRCMMGNNERSIETDMTDVDMTSLYPSAMNDFPGMVIGAPKILDPAKHDRAFLNNVSSFVVDVRVDSIGRDLRIPVGVLKAGETNLWTNRLENHVITVTKVTLEDLETFQNAKVTVLGGYYYDEGHNPRIKAVIGQMFEQRQRFKDKSSDEYNPPMAEVIKLLMNTSYGVLSMKPVDTKTSYLTADEFQPFVQREYNSIREITRITPTRYRAEQYKAIADDYNRIHCSADILAWSKRIMNRVTVLAEDLKIRISYTDTDSIHMKAADLPKLAHGFELRYHREPWYKPLLGSTLSQMHADLKFEGCLARGEDGLLVECTEAAVGGNDAIVAERCVAVGKKIYLDRLRDTAGRRVWHVRLKGIPAIVLQRVCNEEYGGDIDRMFDDLYNGVPVYFDLTIGGAPCFKTLKTHQIASVHVIRKIHCPIEMEF